MALQQWPLYCPWLLTGGSRDPSLGQSAAARWPLAGMGGAACCSSAVAPGHLLWSLGPLGLLPGSIDCSPAVWGSWHCPGTTCLVEAVTFVPSLEGMQHHCMVSAAPWSLLWSTWGGVSCGPVEMQPAPGVSQPASPQPGTSWHFAAHHPVVRGLSPHQLINFVSRPPDLGGPPPRRAVLSMSGLSHGVIRVDAEEKLSVLTVQDVGQVMPGGEGAVGS